MDLEVSDNVEKSMLPRARSAVLHGCEVCQVNRSTLTLTLTIHLTHLTAPVSNQSPDQTA
jgi:hypothetical protein